MIIRICGTCLLFLAGTLLANTSARAQGPALVLAHRGGSYEFDENTLKAFRSSYEKGVRGFETDVRMTKDGVLVILHDDSLNRTYEGTGPVETKTAAELRGIKSKKTGQPFLFLDEFLEYFKDKTGVYLELEMKTSHRDLYPDDRVEEYCKKLYETAEARKPEGATYVYSSFDDRPIRIIHRLDAKAPISLIAGKPCSTEFIQRARSLGADRIACQLAGTSRTAVLEAQKAGLKVNGWPGHGIQDYYLALGLGVDVHCTDLPVAIFECQKRLP